MFIHDVVIDLVKASTINTLNNVFHVDPIDEFLGTKNIAEINDGRFILDATENARVKRGNKNTLQGEDVLRYTVLSPIIMHLTFLKNIAHLMLFSMMIYRVQHLPY